MCFSENPLGRQSSGLLRRIFSGLGEDGRPRQEPGKWSTKSLEDGQPRARRMVDQGPGEWLNKTRARKMVNQEPGGWSTKIAEDGRPWAWRIVDQD